MSGSSIEPDARGTWTIIPTWPPELSPLIRVYGQNLVRISSRWPTCDMCAPWNGVIVALDEPTEQYPYTLDDARAEGLFHPRCLHTITLFLEGFSEPGQEEPDFSEETEEKNKEARAAMLELMEKQLEEEREKRRLRYWAEKAAGSAELDMSAGVGDGDGISTITRKTKFDFNDTKAIDSVFKEFAEKAMSFDIEKAIVISRDGYRYDIDGIEIKVGTHVAGKKALKGAIVIHNHPGEKADSFSEDDFAAFFRYHYNSMEVAYNWKRHRMEWMGERFSEKEAREVYRSAFQEIRENARKTDTPIKNEQYEIMLCIKNNIGETRFYEL